MEQIQQSEEKEDENLNPYDALGSSLSKGTIPSRILLDRLRMIDEESRKSSQYQDSNYLPFYYHLSKVSSPESILNVGFGLGLPLCCFLQGCSTAKRAVCVQRPDPKVFYSPRIGVSNIKSLKGKGFKVDFHSCGLSDPAFRKSASEGFELAMITEKAPVDVVHEAMDVCWEYLTLGGFMTVDYLNSNLKIGEVFKDFCKTKSKEHRIFGTRYGTGVVQK
jgi:hypothetical protein